MRIAESPTLPPIACSLGLTSTRFTQPSTATNILRHILRPLNRERKGAGLDLLYLPAPVLRLPVPSLFKLPQKPRFSKTPIVKAVSVETFRTAAVSSTVRPPKNRSSTTWLLRACTRSKAWRASSMCRRSACASPGRNSASAGDICIHSPPRLRLCQARAGPPEFGASSAQLRRRNVGGSSTRHFSSQ